MNVKQAGRCSRVSATAALRLAVAGVVLGLVLSAPAIGAIAAGQFVEARGPGGALALQDEGETWGASWGDLNGDGFADLWMGKHQYTPAVLMRNNGDGTFSNVIDSAAPLHLDHLRDDTHGAAWADFDGDGDEDLLEVSGGGAGSAATGDLLESYYNNFWVNSGGVLSEQAQAYGIGYPRGRSRTPLWLDYDRDGALDVVITAVQSVPTEYPSAIFRQTASGFVDRTVATGFDVGSCHYGMLSDLSGDGEHDLVCANASQVQGIYDITVIPFGDLRPNLGEDLYSIYPGDLAMGDFNGDLAVDVFTSKVPPSPAAAVQVGSERIHASLPASALEQGFSFAASGDVRIEFGWVTERADIFLGSGAVAPPVDSDPGLIEPDSRPHHVQLVLSAAEPTHLGLPAVRNAGIYLGLVAGRWQVRAVNVGAAVEVVVQAASVSALQAVGAVALDQGSPGVPILFVNQGGVLVQSTTAAAFRDPAAAISSYMRSFVAGDFDNDMDLDVYVGASGRVANVDNLLFDNQGDGTFRLAANAGGAAGSPLGATDSVTTVDYDRDGFLDLFVTQGNFPAPVAYSGVQQLFRNQGNANHWIELDLEGTASNPHGIGATVLARTPDGRVQLREQGNGMHRYSQSHRRIHFGLGPNQRVDLEVRWPSGVVDLFDNLASDRLYALVEGTGGGGGGVSGCGAPTYDPATDGGLYLWEENCGNSTRSFTVRAAGGGSASTVTYAGQVDANQAFGVVTPFSLESTDVLVNSGSQIVYEMNVRSRYQDGFGFGIASSASVCFGLDLPAGTRVLVGPNATPVTAPFDLTTYQSCGAPPPVTDICGAPTYDPATDGGLYLWEENCGNATRSFAVRAAGGGSLSAVTYAGQVDANQPFSVVTPFSLESTDVLVNSGSQIVYEMNVRNRYQDGFGFGIASGASVCFGLDLPAGTPVLVGPNATPVTAPFDLTTYQSCGTPPPATDICGAPTYDKATDAGLYLWEEDCGGATRDYVVRATAGGSTTTLTYAGRATSSASFVSVTPFSLESTDVLTSTGLRIDYSLLVRGAYQDGFSFSTPDGASVCFGLDLPAGTPVRVGPNATPKTAPFSLPNLGACIL